MRQASKSLGLKIKCYRKEKKKKRRFYGALWLAIFLKSIFSRIGILT